MLALLTVGAATRPLGAPAWQALRAKEPALQIESLQGALGQGVAVGLLGGFRGLFADFIWVRAHALWERRDAAAVEAHLRLVTATDPRPLYFWQNAARIIAYDMPTWRVEDAGGYDRVPPDEQLRIDREQATRALEYLEAAARYHPANVQLEIERANIQLNRLHDIAAAAASYRRAAELPGAPYYAARLHGELLRRSGRNAEAYAWLVHLHPTLPATDESAQAEVVLARIRELERQLLVTPANAYRPPAR